MPGVVRVNPPRPPADLLSAAENSPSTLAIFAWLAVQTGALALGALRVPLWARAPAAGEALAGQIVFITQIMAGSALFPHLARDVRSTLVSLACLWPFTLMAGFLALEPTRVTVTSGLFASAWLLALCPCQAILRRAGAGLVGVAIALSWAAAGPVLLFIASEYRLGPPPTPTLVEAALLGPLQAGLMAREMPISIAPAMLWMPLVLLAVLAGGEGWRWRRLNRRISTHRATTRTVA